MDKRAAGLDGLGAVALGLAIHASAHRLDDVLESLLHMRGLARLMLGPAPVEAQYGNAPLVLYLWIELAVGLLVRDHLAAAVEADEGSVVASGVFLELLAVAASSQPFQGRRRA